MSAQTEEMDAVVEGLVELVGNVKDVRYTAKLLQPHVPCNAPIKKDQKRLPGPSVSHSARETDAANDRLEDMGF